MAAHIFFNALNAIQFGWWWGLHSFRWTVGLYVSKWFQFDCSIVRWQTRSVDDFTHVHSNDAIVTEHLKLNGWNIALMILMPSALTFIEWHLRPSVFNKKKKIKKAEVREREREKETQSFFIVHKIKYHQFVWCVPFLSEINWKIEMKMERYGMGKY